MYYYTCSYDKYLDFAIERSRIDTTEKVFAFEEHEKMQPCGDVYIEDYDSIILSLKNIYEDLNLSIFGEFVYIVMDCVYDVLCKIFLCW